MTINFTFTAQGVEAKTVRDCEPSLILTRRQIDISSSTQDDEITSKKKT